MRSRWIVVNPDESRIQGDMLAETAREAANRLDGCLEFSVNNESWAVYRCPASFPSDVMSYNGSSVELVTMLKNSGSPTMVERVVAEEIRIAC